MGHNLDVLVTLTSTLTAALALGLVTHRLRMSPIVGYLLAGVLVGPFTPGFVAHAAIAEQFAELGVILLMFGVGLQFHLHELLQVRTVALPGALVQIGVATCLGLLLAVLVGWSMSAGLVFGLAVSVASTVVLLRNLSDHDALHTHPGHVAVGWLVVEDIFTVFVLVLLPALIGGDQHAQRTALVVAVGLALLKLGGLVAFTFLVGQRVIPKLLEHVAKTRSRELFTLTVLALALGISVGSALLFGVSMALGAFLAGMVVGQSEFSSRAASDALPMRDAFAVLFFVSMGMLFDPARLLPELWLTLLTLAIVIVAKPLAALAVVVLLRRPLRTALVVAVALAQIGEFSFILAALGRQLNVLPEAATQALVVASIVSITINPLLFRAIEPLSRWLGRSRSSELVRQPAPSRADVGFRSIVVGYGPVGRTLTDVLRKRELHPVVIELNHETVRDLNTEGIEAVYGDATQSEILLRAGVGQASSLIYTTATPPEAVIRAARELNPRLLVLTRASYVSEAKSLQRIGANAVVTAEVEVALAMAERLLIGLGATAEQLDRERDRVRTEFTVSQV